MPWRPEKRRSNLVDKFGLDYDLRMTKWVEEQEADSDVFFSKIVYRIKPRIT